MNLIYNINFNLISIVMILLLSNFKHLLRGVVTHSFDHLSKEASVSSVGVQFCNLGV